MVEDVRLLVRAVFVIDRKGVLRYLEVPVNIQTELDYGMAIDVLSYLIYEDDEPENDQDE
jgi:peroxiredoxin